MSTYVSNSSSFDVNTTNSESSKCKAFYPQHSSLLFVCNAIGKYTISITEGCSPSKVNMSNYCLDKVLVYGMPVVDIDCSRCLMNNETRLQNRIKEYIDSNQVPIMYSDVVQSDINISVGCGNGIWCQE